jgi:hypothetical protein
LLVVLDSEVRKRGCRTNDANFGIGPLVASTARSGVPAYDVALRHGLFCPGANATFGCATVPRGIAALDEPAQARFPRLGMVPILDTPQEFARIASDPQERLRRCPKTSI